MKTVSLKILMGGGLIKKMKARGLDSEAEVFENWV
jgi:hypothetical protein